MSVSNPSAASRRRKLSAATALPIEQLENRLLLSSTFAVASTSLPASGPVMLPFNSVDVTYNQTVSPASVSPANLLLSYGTVIGATLTAPDSVRYLVTGINAERQITASVPTGAISDTSGDAVQAFSTTFTTDVGTIPFSGVLSPVGPVTSLAASGTVSDSVGFAGDTDSFTIGLSAGEVFSASVQGTGNLQPTLVIQDPQGNALGQNTGAAGVAAMMQGFQVQAPGTYTVTVGGASGSTGAYTLSAMINAITQPQILGGPTNASRATALNLDSAFVPLGGGASQAAVIGNQTYPLGTTNTDYYAFTLQAGQTATLAVQSSNNSSLQLLDSTGTLLAQGISSYGKARSLLTDFVAPQAGVYYAAVSVDYRSSYGLTVTRNAEFDVAAVGGYAPGQTMASPAFGGVQSAVGTLSGGSYASTAESWQANLGAGSVVHLWTSLPAEGLNGTGDTLIPRITLSNSGGTVVATDDNAAHDHSNASLTYTVAATGNYRINVSAVSPPNSGSTTSGDYVLNVQGAAPTPLPFTVTYPTGTQTYTSAPQYLSITFSQSVLLSSVSASDLMVDGVPATAVGSPSGNILNFVLPTNLSQGTHNYTIAPGAFSDVQGTPVPAVSGYFALDSVPPQVVSSSIQDGSTISAGDLTYIVKFSEPLASYSASATNVSLVGGGGNSIAPASISLDPTATTLTINYKNLPDGAYTLTLLGGIRDLVGNSIAGGNYVVHFTADVQTEAMAGFQPAFPAGSGIYTTQNTGLIGTTTDTDGYMVQLAAGQTLVVQVAPAGGTLVPDVSITDPSGHTLASSTATLPGQPLSISIPAVAAAGEYTVNVAGASSTGQYTLNATVDASVQTANSQGLTSNHSPTSAQDITGALVTGPGSLEQTGVMGTFDSGPLLPQEIEPNDAITSANSALYNFQPYGGSTYQIGLSGTFDTSRSYRWYYLGQLAAGDTLYINGIANPSTSSYTYSLTQGYYSGYQGQSHTPASIGQPLIYSVNSSGPYFLELQPWGYGGGSYQLGIYLQAGPTPPATGAVTVTASAANTTADTAADDSAAWQPVQYRSQTTGSVTGSDVDLFAYRFNAGDVVTVDAVGTNGPPQAALLDASGNALALQEQLNTYPTPPDAYIHAYPITTTGIYYVRVASGSYAGNGPYILNVFASGGKPTLGLAAPDPDYYSIRLNSGQTLSAALTVPAGASPDMQLTDAAGDVLAASLTGATNANDLIENFVAPQSGTYYFRLTGDAATPYTLAVTVGGEFQAAPNDSLLTAQTLGPDGVVVGNLTDPADYYRIWAPALSTLQITTKTPTVPNQPNALDPAVAVYSPGNVLVATDDNSAPDGRNATLSYATQIAGWYTIEVTGNGAGPYVLAAAAGPFNGAPSTPQLLPQSDTGYSSTDAVTNLNNASPATALQFQVSNVLPGNTVTLYSDGTPIGSGSAQDSSIIITTDGATRLSDGQHSITARQGPASGALSDASPAMTLTVQSVNNAAPPTVQLDASSDSGVSNSDGITNVTTPRIDLSGATHYRIYRDGQPVADIANTTYYDSPALADGTYVFTVTGVDLAGNETAASAPISVTIDTTPPSAPAAPTLDPASDSGASNSDGLTNVTAPLIDIPPLMYWQLYQGDSLVSATFATGQGFRSAPLPDGHYSFTLREVDAAGNVSPPSATLNFTIYTQPPAIPNNIGPDASFGQSGFVQAYGQYGSGFDSVAVQGDGEVVAAGTIRVGTVGQFFMQRYNLGGGLDDSFGADGTVTFPVAQHVSSPAVVVQEDGKIVALEINSTGSAVLRFNADGSPDISFGTGGITQVPSIGQSEMVVQPDGKVVVAGTSLTSHQLTVLRLNANGTADATFKASVAMNYPTYRSVRLALGADGQLFLAACGALDYAPGYLPFVVALSPTGAIDTNFGSNGIVTPAALQGVMTVSLAVQPDGSVLMNAGKVLRLDRRGQLDTTFGSNGIATAPAGGYIDPAAVSIQPDGRIMLPAILENPTTPWTTGLIALLPNGTPDATFGSGSLLSERAGEVLAAGPSGTLIIAGGGGLTGSYPQGFVARYIVSDGPLLARGADNGISACDNVLTSAQPTFVVPFGGYGYRFYVDNNAISPLLSPGTTWTAPPQRVGTINFSYTTFDIFGNESAQSPVTPVTIDVAPPSAALFAYSLTSPAPTYIFQVTYTDDSAPDAWTIGHTPLAVTGPNGFVGTATLVSTGTMGSQITATYQIAAPHTQWGYSDNGTYTISLPAGSIADVAGNVMPAQNLGTFVVNMQPVSISGTVFEDVNHDGAFGGEPGMVGLTMYLDLNNNGVLDTGEPTAVTDAYGHFVFGNLPSGTYMVRQVLPAGYLPTTPAAYGQSVTVYAGSDELGYIFGDAPVSNVTMDLSYFMLVSRNFGRVGTFATGDLNGDGTVNLADLLILTRNFGHTLPPTTPAAPQTTAASPALRTRRV